MLIDSMGNDLRIVNAARVSFHKRSNYVQEFRCSSCRSTEILTIPTVPIKTNCPDSNRTVKHSWRAIGHPQLPKADIGLLRSLIQNKHGTPFEKVVFEFHVVAPIGVMREAQRHRIASWNEVSTRYVHMQPSFYVPSGDAIRKQVGKPMDYNMQPLDTKAASTVVQIMTDTYSHLCEVYFKLIDIGLAKEVARNMLPLGLITEAYLTINLRSLFNFVSLRSDKSALLEIQLVSKQIEAIASSVVPVSMALFNEFGRPNGDSWHDCDTTCQATPA